METMTGVVEAVARTGKSIKIGSAWYGAFAAASLSGANVGDEVKFAYQSVSKDGTVYNNIKGAVNVLGGGVPKSAPAPAAAAGGGSWSGGRGALTFPVGPLDAQRVIIRQNALSHATKVVVDSGATTGDNQATAEAVVEIARYFESYVCGDLDMLAATAEF